MKRFSIIAINKDENIDRLSLIDNDSQIVKIKLFDSNNKFDHGLGNFINKLIAYSLNIEDIGIELCIIALLVTAGDKISRSEHAQDSWTREIHLYVPVYNIESWLPSKKLLEKTLNFLSGDKWSIFFRKTEAPYSDLLSPIQQKLTTEFDCVSLFSGGMDSFIGAIDLFEQDKSPLLISHFVDPAITGKHQNYCISSLKEEYNNVHQAKACVKIDKSLINQTKEDEKTLRARSFLFFSLAVLASTGLKSSKEVFIPENGLISLNVPLTSLRLGALSTRTTHPFYMARFQELLDKLNINSTLINPYKYKTKGEMAIECLNQVFVKDNLKYTISCSSPVAKNRGEKHDACGRCMPCIIRRASIEKAFRNDDTTYKVDIKSKTLNGSLAEGENAKSFKKSIKRMQEHINNLKPLIYIPGPLSDYSFEEIDKFADVYKRGMVEVDELLNDVEVI